MSCSSCQAHRDAIKTAVKSGSVKQTVVTTAKAAVALGQNTFTDEYRNKLAKRFGSIYRK